MNKQIIRTPKAPTPVGPYSQAVLSGQTLFCSGQISINPETNEVFTGDIKTQAQMVMKNIGAVLEAAGMNYTHIIKTNIFLTNMADFPHVNEVYASFMKEPYPARSTIAVAALPKGVNVEIEVVAQKT